MISDYRTVHLSRGGISNHEVGSIGADSPTGNKAVYCRSKESPTGQNLKSRSSEQGKTGGQSQGIGCFCGTQYGNSQEEIKDGCKIDNHTGHRKKEHLTERSFFFSEGNDYAEHERTYEMFLTLTKWGVISLVILLAGMAYFLT